MFRVNCLNINMTWRDCNKLLLAAKRLNLGKTYTIEEEEKKSPSKRKPAKNRNSETSKQLKTAHKGPRFRILERKFSEHSDPSPGRLHSQSTKIIKGFQLGKTRSYDDGCLVKEDHKLFKSSKVVNFHSDPVFSRGKEIPSKSSKDMTLDGKCENEYYLSV